jgi:DnaJ-class molecular chaperone
MKLKYFTNCHTIEELKQSYKKLMLQFHPDINPNGMIECQEINAEYDLLFPRLKNTHKNANNETYTSTTDSSELANEFKDIINSIIHLHGIKIEIIGSWIWITGNTKEYKDIFKTLKLKWSSKKLAWYYHNEPFKKKSKNQYNMDGLRNLFGTEEVKSQTRTAIS